MLALTCASPYVTAAEAVAAELANMSLEELLEARVAVSAVSRRPGSVQESAAAVTVVSQEEIRRSGVTTLADALRLVPGMDVARVDSHDWAVSARGFNDLFANKLLVMVDGRSVYASLFSGTFWDVQNVVMDDVDRIEVVRGPGATLWGANAVNGVINVVTRKAANTQGLLISQTAGTEERSITTVRYGGKLTDYLHYRVFAQYSYRDRSALFGTGFPPALIQIETGGGTGSVGSASSPPRTTHDAWTMLHGGFRADWTPPGPDRVTLQGDIYRGREDQTYQRITPGTFGTFYQRTTDTVSGGNVLARWSHTYSNDAESTVQAYYDHSSRDLAVLGESRDTLDVDFQNQFALGRHTVVWGAAYRRIADRMRASVEAALDPSARTVEMFSAFAQDEISLFDRRLALTVGSKFERNDFTGTEVQPNVRLRYTPSARHTFWTAVSRATRTPSRTDHDFRLTYPGVPAGVLFPGAPALIVSVDGNRHFQAEVLQAWEAGYRGQLTDRLSIDVAVFVNEYRRLRGVAAVNPQLDFTQSPVEIGVTFDNLPSAETHGGEVAVNLRLTDRWRLRAGGSMLEMDVHNSSTLQLGSFGADAIDGSSPRGQASLASWFEVSRNVEFDAALRWVDALPALGVPSYVTLDLRLGWRPRENLELSVTGQNLLDRSHPEYRPSVFLTQATEVQRGIYGKVTFRF